ncbi:MAG: VCBS repeat-containing protein [Planctomycetota bacterium]
MPIDPLTPRARCARRPLRALRAPLSSLVLAGSLSASSALAGAQQFTQAAGVLPGGNVWSEGVCAADVDRDGDLDLLFANGDGFSSAGAKRQNVLVINKLIEQGAGVFADESVARLGAHVSNAKMVIAGDVNGDGWVDLLYANAFNTDPPSLYINRGAAQPGYFDLESAARGLTEALSSSGGAFGDVDDDGDLDLVLCDSGSSLLAGAGGVPRLYLNDGAGFFTEAPQSISTTAKRAHMDVQLVDLDGDFAVDLLQANRATNTGGNHYLLHNDGAGSFTDASGLLPATSGSVYEMEVGDLDGDTDLDLFTVSLSNFQEGHIANRLVETGGLAFQAGAAQPGNVDDNELALFDYDMDGDLDVFVGSLDVRERVYRNNGGLSFTDTAGVLPSVADSTLDLTFADLDNNGTYDLITAQGESGSFTNKLYWNNGPVDGRAPRFVAVREPNATPAGGALVVHAKVRDDVQDDGEAYLAAEALVSRVPAATLTVEVTATGFVPSAASVPSGTLVRFVEAGAGAATLSGAAPHSFVRDLTAGGVAERAFVAPASHTVTAFPVPGAFQLTVTGAPIAVAATRSGGDLFRFALPTLPPGATGRVACVLRATDWAGNVGWSDSGAWNEPGVLGVVHCDPTGTSSGAPARLTVRGSAVLAAQSLTLDVSGLPASSAGYFLAARSRAMTAVSQGFLCLGAPQARLSLFVQNSGAAGAVSFALPFLSLPPSAAFQVGEAWSFQYWFRDANPAVGANFSDAVELVWQ